MKTFCGYFFFTLQIHTAISNSSIILFKPLMLPRPTLTSVRVVSEGTWPCRPLGLVGWGGRVCSFHVVLHPMNPWLHSDLWCWIWGDSLGLLFMETEPLPKEWGWHCQWHWGVHGLQHFLKWTLHVRITCTWRSGPKVSWQNFGL